MLASVSVTCSAKAFWVFSGEFGLQPEPSLVLSQLVQRHTGPSLPLARQPSPLLQQQAPPAQCPPASQYSSTPAQAGPVMAGVKPAPSAGLDPQGSSLPQPHRGQLKGPKRRIPPASKVMHQGLFSRAFILVSASIFIKAFI